MYYTFYNASAFNQPLANWKTSKVTSMTAAFGGAKAFNQDISGWDVSSVADMGQMLASSSFNYDISGWNVAKVSTFNGMFANSPFNQDISVWSVQAGCNFDFMFYGATSFSQDLNNWRAKVTSPLSTCSSTPTFVLMFTSSKCPIQSSSLPKDDFCRASAVVKPCIHEAFKKRTWCCKKQLDCKRAIKTECRPILLKEGKTEQFLNQRTNEVVRNRCQ